MLPTIASSLTTIRPVAITPPAGGGAFRLGAKSWLGGEHEDRTLWFVNASGQVIGSFSLGPHAQPTDVEVVHLADTGPMVFRYVANTSGADLDRGTVVKLAAAAGKGEVETAVAGDIPAGVIPFELLDGEACWIPCEGVIDALCDAAVTDGALLTTDAAGELTPTGADITNAVAIAASTTVGAGLAKVRLLDVGI